MVDGIRSSSTGPLHGTHHGGARPHADKPSEAPPAASPPDAQPSAAAPTDANHIDDKARKEAHDARGA
ncbi:MAG: hypothetical protein JWM80_5095, partial [Cyanobacteria bacterium RYN_339]|nr:hypothetical protein [Cyanobacteria bacterium RYN_339]